MGAESDDAVGGPQVNGNCNDNYDYGYAYEGESGSSLGSSASVTGPWTASSLARAEEEFDRFLANMQRRNAGEGGEDRGGTEKCGEDDERSGDSGVAGVGGRDCQRSHRRGSENT
ncbi:hypothetical protein NUW58_g5514 [Xylaria curta]|uniref:Uncharacterized protein n=1 Tax=Xylaria curta TaxID=42375 RepID=A0ACC1P1R6_9PEZI|nr:hypothetical protein NUW58_g5514 [Xylaria curta]